MYAQQTLGEQQKPKAEFKVGDIVKVSLKSPENTKISKTPFEGIVIAKRGEGANKTFTVRKIASGKVAVERIFPIDSPSIDKVTVVKSGNVRRAKLFYLRKQ